MSDFYSTGADRQEAIATLHRALELGVTLLDTADMYGPHTNEELVGKRSGQAATGVPATKFGILRDPADPSARGVSSRPEYIRRSVEAACGAWAWRIDLYYQHRVDPQVPIEDVVGTMADLIREGKIRHIGLSEASVATLERAHKVHPITALQTEYSLWTRDAEQGVLAACERLGHRLCALQSVRARFPYRRYPAAGGSGRGRFPPRQPALRGKLHPQPGAGGEGGELAAQKGVKPSAAGAGTVLAQGKHIVPIPGTKRRRYPEENVAAAEITLSAAELAAIEAVFPLRAAAGDRYGAESMTYING